MAGTFSAKTVVFDRSVLVPGFGALPSALECELENEKPALPEYQDPVWWQAGARVQLHPREIMPFTPARWSSAIPPGAASSLARSTVPSSPLSDRVCTPDPGREVVDGND